MFEETHIPEPGTARRQRQQAWEEKLDRMRQSYSGSDPYDSMESAMYARDLLDSDAGEDSLVSEYVAEAVDLTNQDPELINEWVLANYAKVEQHDEARRELDAIFADHVPGYSSGEGHSLRTLLALLRAQLHHMGQLAHKYNIKLSDVRGADIYATSVMDHEKNVFKAIKEYERLISHQTKEIIGCRVQIDHLNSQLTDALTKIKYLERGTTLFGGFEDSMEDIDLKFLELEQRAARNGSMCSSFDAQLQQERANNMALVERLDEALRRRVVSEEQCMREVSMLQERADMDSSLREAIADMIDPMVVDPNAEECRQAVEAWKDLLKNAIRESNDEIQELKEEMMQMNDRTDQLTRELAAARTELDDLEEKVLTARNEVEVHRQEALLLQKEKVALQNEMVQTHSLATQPRSRPMSPTAAFLDDFSWGSPEKFRWGSPSASQSLGASDLLDASPVQISPTPLRRDSPYQTMATVLWNPNDEDQEDFGHVRQSTPQEGAQGNFTLGSEFNETAVGRPEVTTDPAKLEMQRHLLMKHFPNMKAMPRVGGERIGPDLGERYGRLPYRRKKPHKPYQGETPKRINKIGRGYRRNIFGTQRYDNLSPPEHEPRRPRAVVDPPLPPDTSSHFIEECSKEDAALYGGLVSTPYTVEEPDDNYFNIPYTYESPPPGWVGPYRPYGDYSTTPESSHNITFYPDTPSSEEIFAKAATISSYFDSPSTCEEDAEPMINARYHPPPFSSPNDGDISQYSESISDKLSSYDRTDASSMNESSRSGQQMSPQKRWQRDNPAYAGKKPPLNKSFSPSMRTPEIKSWPCDVHQTLPGRVDLKGRLRNPRLKRTLFKPQQTPPAPARDVMDSYYNYTSTPESSHNITIYPDTPSSQEIFAKADTFSSYFDSPSSGSFKRDYPVFSRTDLPLNRSISPSMRSPSSPRSYDVNYTL